MSEIDLKRRTKAFALRVLKLVDAMPKTTAGRALASQMVRSGTSVAANYRAAQRAKSHPHFVSKLGDVEEEADETLFWIELVEESGLVPPKRLSELKKEADELVAIIVAAIRTAKSRKAERQSRNPKLPTSAFRLPPS